MESDRFVTVCDKSLSSREYVIVDLEKRNSVKRESSPADAALAHPHLELVALRYDTNVHLLDLQTHCYIKSGKFPDTVEYWRWVSSGILGVVTKTAVYHWSHEDDGAPPTLVFTRNTSTTTNNVQIINYQVSNSQLWCLLVALVFEPDCNEPNGILQLYSVCKETSRNVQGRNGAFAVIKPVGYSAPIEVLCYEHKRPNESSQLAVVQIGKDQSVTPTSPPIAPRERTTHTDHGDISQSAPPCSTSPRCASVEHGTDKGSIYGGGTSAGGDWGTFVEAASSSTPHPPPPPLPSAIPSYRGPPTTLPEHARCAHDFPVTLTVSAQYGLLYIISRHGCLHIVDIHTSHILFSKKIITGSVFVACLHRDGLLCISRRCGDVLHIRIDYERLLRDCLRCNGMTSPYVTQLAARLQQSVPTFPLRSPRHLVPCPTAWLGYDILDNLTPGGNGVEIISSSLKTSNDPMENTCRMSSTRPTTAFSSCPSMRPTTTATPYADGNTSNPDLLSWAAALHVEEKTQQDTHDDWSAHGGSDSHTYSTGWETYPSPAEEATEDYSTWGGDGEGGTEDGGGWGGQGTLCDGSPYVYPYKQNPQEISHTHTEAVAAAAAPGPCEECTALLHQLATTLDSHERLLKEHGECRQQLDILKGNMELLESVEDCEEFEAQVMNSLVMVKERKKYLLQSQRAKEREDKLCVICQERERNVVLIPCGHLCICQICSMATGLTTCPMDRRPIENHLVVYL